MPISVIHNARKYPALSIVPIRPRRGCPASALKTYFIANIFRPGSFRQGHGYGTIADSNHRQYDTSNIKRMGFNGVFDTAPCPRHLDHRLTFAILQRMDTVRQSIFDTLSIEK